MSNHSPFPPSPPPYTAQPRTTSVTNTRAFAATLSSSPAGFTCKFYGPYLSGRRGGPTAAVLRARVEGVHHKSGPPSPPAVCSELLLVPALHGVPSDPTVIPRSLLCSVLLCSPLLSTSPLLSSQLLSSPLISSHLLSSPLLSSPLLYSALLSFPLLSCPGSCLGPYLGPRPGPCPDSCLGPYPDPCPGPCGPCSRRLRCNRRHLQRAPARRLGGVCAHYG